MVSEKFRHQLRKESQQWQTEGLISSGQYEELSQRYGFNQLDSAASDRFISILIGLGCILLGLGAITFVAANWQDWSRNFRVILLLAVFLSVNISGFYLWRQPTRNPGKKRLGHGLLLFGSLILGANMALMSQLFHQSGPVYELFLYWSLGILPMAFALRLTSLGVLAQILLAISYGSALTNWWRIEEFTFSKLLIEHLPILISLLFIPLAYWCGSRVIFALASIGITMSFIIGINPFALGTNGGGILAAIAFTIPPALLWGYRDDLWKFTRIWIPRMPDLNEYSFQAISRAIALCFFAIFLYFFSFHGVWDRWLWSDPSVTEIEKFRQFLPDVFLLSVFAFMGWLQIFKQPQNLNPFQTLNINNGMILILMSVINILLIVHLNITPILPIATIAINILLAWFAIGLIRDALTLVKRTTFWYGMVLLVLQITSRMFEYDTELLLKAIVFVVCGVAIIMAGLWFERQLKAAKAKASLPESI